MQRTFVVAVLCLVMVTQFVHVASVVCTNGGPPEGTYLVLNWAAPNGTSGPPASNSTMNVQTDNCIIYRGYYEAYQDSFVAFYSPVTRMLTGGWMSFIDFDWGAINHSWNGTVVAGEWCSATIKGISYEEWTPDR